jgi:trimethylguanosine synthase
MKGWRYRYELFEKFDEGVRFDDEGFEASKAEAVAIFVAKHLPGKIVLDAFSGIGGSAIGFARAGKRVISIEKSGARSQMAQHNAAVYNVAKRIRFVVGDTMKLWRRFDFDAAYFDPPWGGVNYEKHKSLRFSSFKPNVLPLIKTLINSGKSVGTTLPLNFDLNELYKIHRNLRIYFNEQYGKPYCIHCIWRTDAET